MSEFIKSIPLVPEKLREAARCGVLIPFVGAGASRIAGCPGWNDFADKTLKYILDKDGLSHGQLAQISHLSPRIKLSTARKLEYEHKIDINFREILSPDDGYNNANGCRLYEWLGRLGNVFVTTNYDEWLDNNISTPTTKSLDQKPDLTTDTPTKRTIIYQVEDFMPTVLNNQNTVIHLHGSVLDPKNMIMATHQYMKHYSTDWRTTDKENPVLALLQYLFTKKTVLFIGYGLEELETLEYIILKTPKFSRDLGDVEHYLLQGFFEHEYELMNSLKYYYSEECGIELIPFSRDRNDWYQLLDVLEYFASEIPAMNP